MPKLSPGQPFGPIPASVTLDGSGNGTVQFQATGTPVRITNLFGGVATATAQASVSVYVGPVSITNRVFNNNSGSTGFTASGQIDVPDGTIIYVVWTGGDVGAIATATFSGRAIPFDQITGGFSMVADDPIAAGDGTLIFPAIKSSNYVPGVSGWSLERDGDFEAQNATIRGSIVAGNGLVTLNNGGIAVEDATHEHEINFVGGFLSRTKPPNGSYVEMVAQSSTGFVGLALNPLDPTPINALAVDPALIDTDITAVGSNEYPFLRMTSPQFAVGPTPESMITLFGESSAGSVTLIRIDAARVKIDQSVLQDANNFEYFHGQQGGATINVPVIAAGAGANFGPFNFPVAFPAGVTPRVITNFDSGAGNVANCVARAQAITNTGFNVRLINAGALATVATNGTTVSYIAIYP